MAKNSGSTILVILIVGCLATALLFGSQIMGFINELPSLIEDFLNQIRNGGGSGGSISGSYWIGYTVNYVDGTSEEIREDAPTFSLVPLSITFHDKDILNIQVHFKAALTCRDTMENWNTKLSMQTEIYKGTETTPKTSATATYTKTGSIWVNGETKVLATYTVQAQTLEGLVSTYGDGKWHLNFKGLINDLTVTINGAPVALTLDDPALGGVDFVYVNETPTSLSVTGRCSYVN